MSNIVLMEKRIYIKGRDKAEYDAEYRKTYSAPRVTVTCPECKEERQMLRHRAKGRSFVACKKHLGPIVAREFKERTGHGVGWTGSKYFGGQAISQIKRNARKNGHEYSLTNEYLDQLWEAQEGLCALTCWKMSDTMNDPRKRSLDRIDSSRGYVEGNVQWTCWIVNNLKNTFHQNEFLELCNAVARCRKESK